MNDPSGSPKSKTAEDKKAITRGAFVNFAGHLLKLGHPLLLAICTRLYDAGHWGAYVAMQALLMIATRICLMGFDKGILWWVPRHHGDQERAGIRPALWLAGISSGGAVFAVVALIAAGVGKRFGYSGMEDSIQIMALGIVPFVLMEILVHAAMGRQRMEVNIAVKETLVPLSFIGCAALYFFLGFRETGLALAFLSSNFIGLGLSVFAFRLVFKNSAWPKERLWPTRELVRYSLPTGGAEIANTFLQRLDVLALSAFASPEVVGVYGVASMFGNAVRSIRRSFDPIVTAVISHIGSSPDPVSSRKRVAASFSYAWLLVTAVQLPIFAFLLCFAKQLLGLYGPDFMQGAAAVIILCGFWTFNGAGSLAGLVVTGLGRSDLGLFNVLAALAGQILFLTIFLSPFGFAMGMEGAALSVGLSYTLQNILQHVQMKKITGLWNYTRQVRPVILAGIAGTAVLFVVFWTSQSFGHIAARALSFLAFSVVYGGALLHFWSAEAKRRTAGAGS